MFWRFVIIRWPIRNRQSAPIIVSDIEQVASLGLQPFLFFGRTIAASRDSIAICNHLDYLIWYICRDYAVGHALAHFATAPSPRTVILLVRSAIDGFTMKLRTDMDTAQAVENGLVVDEVSGSASAWTYLSEHGVPPQVILRVLVSQSRRRQTDPVYQTRRT